jgi:chaperonin GroEL
MQKIVNSGKAVMDKILAGVNLVADPVKSTISPKGRTVIIGRAYVAEYNVNNMPIEVTKDGFKVSESISSPDPETQLGVLFIQEACRKQMSDAGDATSTTALLVQAILTGGLTLIEDGASSVEVVKGINAAVEYVVAELKKMSTPIDGDVEKIRAVATTCSNGDKVIGDLIAEAFSKTGADGVINIEEAKGRETSIKISDGIKFHRGWASQYFVTNKAKAECVLENPYILIYDRPITILKDFMPLLEKILIHENQTKVKRPLMVFCDAADGDPLATLTFNNDLFHRREGGLQSCVVEMAFLGQYKKDFMEDIAAATGGVFINELKGTKLENVTLQQLGQAKKVVVGKDETVIIGGLKDEKIFNSLAKNIKDLEEAEEDPELKELLKKRLARLKSSVAILSVGATTEVEMKEKKDRVDDAVRATRSAIEEGFIPGSGTAFLRVPKLEYVYGDNSAIGMQLIISNLGKSFEQICKNAGVDEDSTLSQIKGIEIKDYVMGGNSNFGYNAKTNKVEDLVLAGIIEPTKSNRCALQNAASVVCQILSSQYMITDTL